MSKSRAPKRVLAIDPRTRGVGFGVLEGSDQLIDWGVKRTRENKREQTLAKVKEMIGYYRPTVLVIEDCSVRGARRSARIRSLLREIAELAKEHIIKVKAIPGSKVRKVLAGSDRAKKHRLARIIAQRFPELKKRLPPYRKPWMSEDYRMSIFDAIGLALTVFPTPVDGQDTR